jgi:hypothetical protein
MAEYTYQIHETENGTHILIFKEDVFERKEFVPVSEYHPDSVATVVNENFLELFTGSHDYVVWWIKNNPGQGKMVGAGSDFQILPVKEYLSHRG